MQCLQSNTESEQFSPAESSKWLQERLKELGGLRGQAQAPGASASSPLPGPEIGKLEQSMQNLMK